MHQMLTTKDIEEVLSQTLPKENDFAFSDYKEELKELLDFGVKNKFMFLNLIVKHRQEVLAIDADPLDDFHIQYYKTEYGDDYVNYRINNKFWFAYPALIRITLELEFGEKYIDYSNRRDNI